jgi:hypothetical protein
VTGSMPRRLSVATAASAAALLVASAAFAAVTWTLVPLDSNGFGASAATTPSGSAAVAWWLPSSGGTVSSAGLRLATGSGNSFTTATVTTSDLAYPDLAYGSDGTAHISAGIDNGSGGLGYVAYAGGVAAESVVTTDFLADRTSIGVDGSGRPHIAYATYVNGGVYVATLDAGTWTPQLIWSGDAIGPRIAVEADGTNHVVFAPIDPDTGNTAGVMYATDATGSWVLSAVTTDPVDVTPDIAVESTGVVDIAYAHQSAHGAGVLLQRGGASPKLIARGSVDSPMLALGSADALYIAYWEFGGHGQGLHVTNNVKGRFVDSLVSTQGEGGAPMAVTAASGTTYVAFDIPGSCCPATGGLQVAHN